MGNQCSGRRASSNALPPDELEIALGGMRSSARFGYSKCNDDDDYDDNYDSSRQHSKQTTSRRQRPSLGTASTQPSVASSSSSGSRSSRESQELRDRAYAEELMRQEREMIEEESLDEIQAYTDSMKQCRNAQPESSPVFGGIQNLIMRSFDRQESTKRFKDMKKREKVKESRARTAANIPAGLSTFSPPLPPPGQNFIVSPKLLKELEVMGFSRDICCKALTRTRNDKDLAVEYLLSRGRRETSASPTPTVYVLEGTVVEPKQKSRSVSFGPNT